MTLARVRRDVILRWYVIRRSIYVCCDLHQTRGNITVAYCKFVTKCQSGLTKWSRHAVSRSPANAVLTVNMPQIKFYDVCCYQQASNGRPYGGHLGFFKIQILNGRLGSTLAWKSRYQILLRQLEKLERNGDFEIFKHNGCPTCGIFLKIKFSNDVVIRLWDSELAHARAILSNFVAIAWTTEQSGDL